MDYEKAYKEALSRAKEAIKYPDKPCFVRVDEIFPELKLSEDERIRKAIHIYLDWLDGRKDYAPKGEFSIKDMIAWLEKQGEQKSINKIEPKFKVGDWVVFANGNVGHITSAGTHGYTFDDGDYLLHENCDKQAHLWSIADAKDGDVLATENFIFIFKNIDNGNGVHYYCQYETSKHEDDNQFDVALPQSLMGRVGNSIFHYLPTTKIQRDLLFQKMQEAGYTFDFEKKELKKIEDEPENYKQQVVSEMTDLVEDYIKQKPAWSEEDEKMLSDAIGAVSAADYYAYDYKGEIESWLKSLKQRLGGGE